MPISTDDAESNVVIIIPLKQERCEIIGILPEHKVLKMNIQKEVSINMEPMQVVNGITTTQEKRIKFSQSNDEGSIGNTSDNLEVISEAASNHSVDSSIEMENEDQNDNLSDMISANVSGRGSPNISGRDTPSSQVRLFNLCFYTDHSNLYCFLQVIENDDQRPQENRLPQAQNPPTRNDKQIRSEIDDKFCKFEIKKLLEGDETISIISDTWSTDVLASDSETIDASDRNEQQMFAPILEQSIEAPITSNQLLDLSETQSESAWSTDVLASDNDDAISVAPSDDSASVTRSETVEENGILDITVSTGRRLSSPSPSSNNYQPQHLPSLPKPISSMLCANEHSASYSFTNSNVNQQEFRRVEMTSNMNKIMKNDTQNNNVSTVNEIMEISNHTYEQRVTSIQQENMYKHNLDVLDGKLESNKFEENSNDILLSNSSLNSSYSSSSNSSENHKQINGQLNGTKWNTNRQWMNSSESSLNITSTPSESTSELSVLSVNSLVSPMNNLTFQNKKSAVVNHKFAKPNATTGAIPKSISFDMSADKGDRNFEDDQKSKRMPTGFLGKLKMGMSFKNRRVKNYRGPEDFSSRFDGDDDGIRSKKLNGNGECSRSSPQETSDEILAKYRTKPQTSNEQQINLHIIDKPLIMDDQNDHHHHHNIDSNVFFLDTKRKLRLVLSNTNNFHLVLRKVRYDLVYVYASFN